MSRPRAEESGIREAHALALRRRGLTFREIAREVGYKDGAGAQKAVRRAIKGETRTGKPLRRHASVTERVDALLEAQRARRVRLRADLTDAYGYVRQAAQAIDRARLPIAYENKLTGLVHELEDALHQALRETP